MTKHYRPMPGGPWFPLVILGFFGVFAVGMVFSLLAGSGPPAWFAVIWLAALAWNAYWFLWRLATDLWLDGNTLHWKAPFRSGSVDVSAIEEIRPRRMAGNVEMIRLSEGRPILTMATRGIEELNSDIVRLHPGLPVRVGRSVRLSNVFQLGGSRYR